MNGLLIQWLFKLNGNTSTKYYKYPVEFTSTPTVIGTICIPTSETRRTDAANIVINESNKLTHVGILNGGSPQNIVAIGY